MFFFAFAEACIGIGLFVSGLFLVTVASWIYTSGTAGIAHILLLAFSGAALSDHVGFYVGRWCGPGLHQIEFVKKRRVPLQRAERLISDYGAIAIFIGRLVPAIRSLIPAMLGMSRFKTTYYSILDIAACLVWSLGLGAIIIGVDQLL